MQTVQDDFSTPGPLDAGWTNLHAASEWEVGASNQAIGAGLNGPCYAVFNGPQWVPSPDQWVEVSAVGGDAGSDRGPIIRGSDVAEAGFYFMVLGEIGFESTCELVKLPGFMSIGTGGFVVDGDVLRLEIQGNLLRALINGAATITTVEASAYGVGDGYPGMFAGDSCL